MKRVVSLAALVACALPALAQRSKWHEEFIKHFRTSKEFTLAVAGQMPADGYNFKPNREEMGFGVLMAHIATANAGNFALVGGIPPPAVPDAVQDGQKSPEGISKEVALKYLTESFDFCLKVLESVTEAQLDALTGPNKTLTGRERIWSYFTHTAHHRGQAEVYLRVRNITPVNYRF